jgi:hypothetical protein
VYCVIIGFSLTDRDKKRIYQYATVTSDPVETSVKQINAYLVDGDTIFIMSRTRPICNVPEIGIGNKPIDDGNYLFKEDEKNEFLKKEPIAEKWFRKWIGSDEFINGYFRYCLWIGDCPPNELRMMPECMKRIEAVRQFRLKSISEGTRNLAETPCRFHVENMPSNDYIVIPETSSERRKYIPIGFITPDILSSNAIKIIPNATLYHFGILTSTMHMAWTRYVCGRLELRYRYSKDIVYNNFPWPSPTEKQTAEIEKSARPFLADIPHLFAQIAQPKEGNYIVIPKVSSEKRKYIPMGFLSSDIIATDLVFIIPHATMYHFGILTSTMHMAWTRYVCGRLELRYRYSKDIVYNNFPWPSPTEKQTAEIETLAQNILDTRAQFPNASLADLYDPIAMPPVLSKAHQKLDKAVEAAYGRSFDDDSQRVAYLFEQYQKLSGELFVDEKKRGKGRKG